MWAGKCQVRKRETLNRTIRVPELSLILGERTVRCSSGDGDADCWLYNEPRGVRGRGAAGCLDKKG